MKFSWRLIFLSSALALGLCVVVIYQLHFTSFVTDRLGIQGSLLNHVNKMKQGTNRGIPSTNQNQMCSPLLNSHTYTNLNTHTILHKLDSMYNLSVIDDPYEKVSKYLNFPDKPLVNLSKREEQLHVIVVPHSHSDPGWLKTLDVYFQGQTKPTLDNMVKHLVKYPNMTFIWAESVFLKMWFEKLDSGTKETVKKLIGRKQLEIVVGSWVVPDEATTHYIGLIDQLIEGHQWLETNLGVKPQNTWSLDPFGYSPTLTYLYKKSGFKNMVILRVNQFLKSYLQGSNNMEFLWRQHWDVFNQTDMFCTMLPFMLYGIKFQCGTDETECRYFDFRNIRGEISESLAEEITDANVKQYATRLLMQFTKKNQLYNHNVVLVPLGDDFRYDRELEWTQQYENYQKLFQYMNSNKEWKVHARFGTLSDYFNQVAEEVAKKPMSFPALQGDFFPYSDKKEDYWTGFFSTRAHNKNLIRELETYLRTADIFNVLAKALSKASARYMYYKINIDYLSRARKHMALFQHHDGITGTARAYVVMDYEGKLRNSLSLIKTVIERSVQFLIAGDRDKPALIQLKSDLPKSLYFLNPDMNIASVKNHQEKVLIVMNPSSQSREDVIRVTVDHEYLEVFDENDNIVMSQINPMMISGNRISRKMFQLIFFAKLPPLGMIKYTIVPLNENQKPRENLAAFVTFSNFKVPIDLEGTRFLSVAPRGETIILDNNYLRVRFSASNGYLQSITTKTHLSTKKINTELLMYKSARSGAYIFAPAGPAVDTEMFNLPPIVKITGPVVSEIHVYQRENVCEHISMVYNSTGLLGTIVEINNIANMSFKDDKELIMRFTTDIKGHDNVFYTDLNGFHSIKRKPFVNFPKEANYYPLTSYGYMEDAECRLSILASQSHGISSQEEGSLEVMLDRKPGYDDGKGLGESIFETKPSPSRFFLLLEKRSPAQNPPWKQKSTDNLASLPSLQVHLLLELLQHHSVVVHVEQGSSSLIRGSFQGMDNSLPCDTRLVSLRGIIPDNVDNHTALPLTAAMILHNQGYDCSFPLTGTECANLGQLLIPKTLFKTAKLKSMKSVSLSLMYDFGEVDISSELDINPMDIFTSKIVFDKL